MPTRAGQGRLKTLLAELMGHADDTSNFVYLSDGGHFDNLGLYEMLRRRCKYILVVDAGQDERYKYEDLGHALQRGLIDLGVEISFVQGLAVGSNELLQTGAYAEITYAPENQERPAQESETGRLIYLKPWLPKDLPTELSVFKQLKQSFPHETTADQLFSESDFESYRRLGEALCENLLFRIPRRRNATRAGERVEGGRENLVRSSFRAVQSGGDPEA